MIDKLVEHCQDKYKEELQANLTLANILCWLLFVISYYIFFELKQDVFLLGLSEVRLTAFFDFEVGVFSKFTILNLIASLLFVFVVFWLSRSMTSGVIYLYSLREDLEQHIINCTIKLSKIKREDSIGMAFLGRESSEKLERNRERYFKRRGIAQVILCFGMCALVGGNFSVLNVLTFLFSLVAFFIASWVATGFYTAEVLPYYVAKQYVQGELAYFEKGVGD